MEAKRSSSTQRLAARALAVVALLLCPGQGAIAAAAEPATATGAYAPMHETDPSLSDYVIFRPKDLRPFGPANPLPVVGWVNGGCRREGSYVSFLEEVASHGYLVVAPGSAAPPQLDGAAPPPAKRLTTSERFKRIAPPQISIRQLLDGVDWVLAEAARRASIYTGKIDGDKLAVMGHSCGGMRALEASVDARIKTTVVLAAGYWRLGGDLPGIGLTRETLQRLHAPVIYLFGGASDIVYVNAEADFVEINQVPIFKAYQEVGHGLSLRQANGGAYGKVVVDWLQWQLRRDPVAAQRFVGDACALCTDPTWVVEKKMID